MASIQSAGISDVGMKRKGNEDSYFLDADMGLYVVADGMGGHAAGEVASKIVVDTMRDFMRQFINNPSGASQLPVSDDQLSPESNLLVNAVHMANQAVFQQAKKKLSYQGMGSTVSAVLFKGDRMSVVNVGDSPIYLFRGETVETISTPHTMMAEYQEIAPDSAKKLSDHLRHVLTRAMGLKDQVEPAIREMPLTGEETVLICSDGLSDKLSPEEIQVVLAQEAPDPACRKLVKMANDRGGDDNITIIIARLEDSKLIRRSKPAAAAPEASVEKGASAAKPAAAKAKRIAVDYDTDESSHHTFVSKVSKDGIFLETTEAVSVGEEIWITLTPEGSNDHVMITGRVIERKPTGIDVQFQDLTPDQIRWIEEIAEP